jgi:hypothetical protein
VDSSAAVNAELSQLLADAQQAMDKIRRQQRETGGFDRDAHVEVAAKVGMMSGFHQALIAVGVKRIPADLVERMGQLAEDARALRYRGERPGPPALPSA